MFSYILFSYFHWFRFSVPCRRLISSRILPHLIKWQNDLCLLRKKKNHNPWGGNCHHLLGDQMVLVGQASHHWAPPAQSLTSATKPALWSLEPSSELPVTLGYSLSRSSLAFLLQTLPVNRFRSALHTAGVVKSHSHHFSSTKSLFYLFLTTF